MVTTAGPARLPESPHRLADKLAGYPDCAASGPGAARLPGHLTGGISPPDRWTDRICQTAVAEAAAGWCWLPVRV